MNVGRIVASVTIENAVDRSKALTCDALSYGVADGLAKRLERPSG